MPSWADWGAPAAGAPYRCGDRVRCVALTAATPGGIARLGRAGTVQAVRPGADRGTGWVVTVAWDDLLPWMLRDHAEGEVAPLAPPAP